MEATALCVRLLMNVLFLVTEHHHSYSQTVVYPHVVPNRQQHFEHESIFFNCEGFDDSAEWRVLRRLMGVVAMCGSTWKASAGPCNITPAMARDSGKYWCEDEGGRRSSPVNIIVTGGAVILESPVLQVMEGDDVTLSCRTRMASSNLKADFYKGGLLKESSSTANMTIHNVSTSDEGLYKCRISGAGESAESLMSVRGGAVILESPALPVMEGDTVTLRCRNKKTSSNYISDFYKDSSQIETGYTGSMTLHNVSKSDEGFYKCVIPGAGESAKSWLSVRVFSAFHEEAYPSNDCSPHGFVSLRILGTILLMALGLAVGLLYWRGEKEVTESQRWRRVFM